GTNTAQAPKRPPGKTIQSMSLAASLVSWLVLLFAVELHIHLAAVGIVETAGAFEQAPANLLLHIGWERQSIDFWARGFIHAIELGRAGDHVRREHDQQFGLRGVLGVGAE